MHNSIIKSILSFVWCFPYIYMFFDTYFILDYRISHNMLQYSFYISLVASLVLFVLWYREFNIFNSINKAFKAVKNNDITTLHKILFNVSIFSLIKDYKTILEYAIELQSDQEMVAYLLSNNAQINYQSNDVYNISYTLFYLSSNYNFINEQMVEYLLNKGADYDFIDNADGFNGLSLLQVFVLREHKSIIKLLIQRGANIRYVIEDISMNALMLAAKYSDDPFIIKLLIDSGAVVNKINKDGYCALLYAAEFNPNPAIIKMLVSYGARIEPYTLKNGILSQQDVTPLFLAASYNNVEVVKTLINMGDDIGYINNKGVSVIFSTLANNTSLEVVKTLLSFGLELDDFIDKDGNTPLMVAAYLNSNPKLIRYIIQRSHNLGTKNKEGYDFIDYLKKNTSLSNTDKDYILNKWM